MNVKYHEDCLIKNKSSKDFERKSNNTCTNMYNNNIITERADKNYTNLTNISKI